MDESLQGHKFFLNVIGQNSKITKNCPRMVGVPLLAEAERIQQGFLVRERQITRTEDWTKWPLRQQFQALEILVPAVVFVPFYLHQNPFHPFLVVLRLTCFYTDNSYQNTRYKLKSILFKTWIVAHLHDNQGLNSCFLMYNPSSNSYIML